MTVHDWARVDDGTSHDFHNRWITHLTDAMNTGLLPPGYFAWSEQHYGRPIADLIALHENGNGHGNGNGMARDGSAARLPGAIAVAEAPPKSRARRLLNPIRRTRDKSVAVRRVADGRIVAIVEIVSPGNKDGETYRKTYDPLPQITKARLNAAPTGYRAVMPVGTAAVLRSGGSPAWSAPARGIRCR